MVDNLTFLYDVVTDELPVSFLNCGHELVTEHSYRSPDQTFQTI